MNGRKNSFAFLAVVFLLLSFREASAATYYWIRSTAGGWALASNWSLTSGGAGGAGIPGLGDVAIFDGGGVGNCVIASNVSLASGGGLSITSGYPGTISFGAGVTLAVGNSHFTQRGGTFTCGSGNVTIQGRFRMYGGTFTAPTAQLDLQGDSVIFGGGTFNHNNGTVRFSGQFSGGNQYITGNQNFYNVNFHGTYAPTYFFIVTGTTLNAANNLTFTDNGTTGSIVLRTGTVAVQGQIYLSTLNGTYGDATVRINGTGNQTIFGMASNNVSGLPGVHIQKTAGTLTLQNFVSVNASWTYSSGTLSIGTSTVTFYRGIYAITITGTHTLYNVTFHSASGTTYTVAAGTTLSVNGTLTYSATANAITINTGNISAYGNFILNNTSTAGGGTATITMTGTSPQSVTSNVAALQSKLCNFAISKASGTVTLSGVITAAANWTYTSGVVSAGTSTVVFCGNSSTFAQAISGTHTLNNVDISPQTASAISYTVAAASTLTVAGTLTISGTTGYSINNGTIEARGNVTVTNVQTATSGNTTIRFTGTANQVLTGSGTIAGGKVPGIMIDKTGGTLSIATAILSVASHWTYVQGTVSAANSAIYFYNTSTITGQSASGSMSFYDVFMAGTIAMGSNLDVDHNFRINSGTFDVTVANYTLYVGNDWTNLASASTASFNQRNGTVVFQSTFATSQLTLASAAHVETFFNLEMNGNGILLNHPVSVSNNLNLILGRINTQTTTFDIMNGATATGASDASYVNGPCRKTGNQAFVFPVGQSGFYRPIAISAPASVTDYYTARYYLSNPDPTYNIASHDPTLQLIDQCEYWTLTQSPGGTNVVVTLSWNSAATPSCTVAQPSTLAVAHWDGSSWRDDGNGGATGTLSAGTVSGAAANTGYGPFTLASTTFSNPLPIELLHFSAVASGTFVQLNWSTATETNNDFFTVERTQDGATFETVAIVGGAGNSSTTHDYATRDEHPLIGTSYYRLKQTDHDGQFTYSEIIPVTFERTEAQFTVFPNPSPGAFSVSYPGDEATVVVMEIHDPAGRLVSRTETTAGLLNRQPVLLPPGVYYLTLSGPGTRYTRQIVAL